MNKAAGLPRLLASLLDTALKSSPVVVVTGSRQTGKSTLVRELLQGAQRLYRTLDDPQILERATREPESLLQGARRITLDEVQRAPGLLLAVKRAVDERREPGRFLLTGSANLLLMKHVSETLAGRALHLTLRPLTRREQRGEGSAGVWSELLAAADADWPAILAREGNRSEDWRALAHRGGYPTPAHALATDDERALWFSGYEQTYLERDLRDLANVASLVDFRRLMRACCLRIGGLVNQTDLARDTGLSQPTVHRHLDLLEVSYQLIRLPAYAVNRTKRLIKSPKLYWSDTGLAMHLTGESAPGGAHLENLVLTDLLAWRDGRAVPSEVLYWRTAAGEEVDFVIESRDKLLPIEVKSTSRPRLDDISALRSFREEYGKRSRAGLLLHTGTETSWLAEGVLATPWWRVL